MQIDESDWSRMVGCPFSSRPFPMAGFPAHQEASSPAGLPSEPIRRKSTPECQDATGLDSRPAAAAKNTGSFWHSHLDTGISMTSVVDPGVSHQEDRMHSGLSWRSWRKPSSCGCRKRSSGCEERLRSLAHRGSGRRLAAGKSAVVRKPSARRHDCP